MFENITRSFQESIMGWKMFLGGGMQNMQSSAQAQKTELGTALIGGGFSAAQQRFVGVKAGQVSAQVPGEAAPVGVRYMTSGPITPGYYRADGISARGIATYSLTGEPVVRLPPEDPGTPATVVERIQKSISNSAEGWRMGFASVIGKAQTLSGNISERMLKTQRGVEKSAAGVGEWFGNLGEGISSMKWLLYIIAFVLIFVAVMTSIGYSGVGGPAARVAEREYVKRR
jgi:hypothetical protein